MDIQVLNEIANLTRQASLSKVSASVSANAQLKGLKGNLVSAPGNPATPAFEDSPEQDQAPVAPEISSVARAASAYSAAVGGELNSDELNAIQDLAGKVRTAVSEFLSQPGLEQAENAAAVVTSNPEAVQEFTSGVEQAVAATLSLPATKGEAIVNVAPPNVDLPEEVPAPEKFISVERITHGAEPNNPVVAASPALQNAQAGRNARVETPVSQPDAVATPQQEPETRPETVPANPQEAPVIAASPALQNANAQSAVVESPVNITGVPETSNRDFTVTAASPALQNAQAGGNARVETPVSQPDAVATPQQKPVNRPEKVANNLQETPVIPVSPARVHSRASENTSVENPVAVESGVETSSRDFTVTATSPALQNAQAGGNARVETPVSRPDVVSPDKPETPVIATSPALVHSRASENTSFENPVAVESGVETSSRDFTVTAASPALQNAQAVGNARVETPVSRSDAIIPQQTPQSQTETVATHSQEVPVTAASPALQNAQAAGNARVETSASRSDTIIPQQTPQNQTETVATHSQEVPVTAASPALQNVQAAGNARVETPVSRPDAVSPNNQETPVTAASPALQNAQAQSAEVDNRVNTPAPSVNQGQGSEGTQAKPVNLERAAVSLEGASRQAASGQANPQPASPSQSGPAQSSGLFAQDNAAVNPENIRNVNELVNAVVDNELTSEAKKIFSESKVIRTVADLADFILERLREIIASQQQQSQSSGEFRLS